MSLLHRIRWWINRRRFPDQAYFWTSEWQAGEREADEDYAAGRFLRFEAEAELMAWLRDDNPEVTQ